MRLFLYSAAIVAAFAIPSAVIAAPTAQQTLMKTCNADATKQGLKGDPRKDFMKTCLSSKSTTPASATLTTAAPAPATAATTDTTSTSQQTLMKTCNADATKQGLKGDPRKAFMKTCLSSKTNLSATTTTTALPATATTLGTNQFSTEATAKTHCPTDLVVWLNTSSKIYHYAGTRDYGKTTAGVYMCQKDANTAGDKAAKDEKAPTH